LILACVAPFIGSFLGVLIRRLPTQRPIALARSVCESCEAVISPRDLIPIVSYFLLRFRCRNCGATIPGFHLAIELLPILVPLWAAAAGVDGAPLWFGCVLGWTLLALGWIDWRHMILPDVLTLPLLLVGLFATWVIEPDQLFGHAAGAAAGYLALTAVAIAYRWARGHDGLGQGDAKLLAAAGAWLGVGLLSEVILLAALAGLAVALVLHLGGRRMSRTTALPFGPCLAFATWVLWLYGDLLTHLSRA
jgi:leader peptidase (prepilin peptidase)/N-methyltransferase